MKKATIIFGSTTGNTEIVADQIAENMPGYTVEVGLGENPLPLAQFPEIYRSCLPLLLTAALGKIPVDKWGEGE